MLKLKLKLFGVLLLIDIVGSVKGLFTELMVLINNKRQTTWALVCSPLSSLGKLG